MSAIVACQAAAVPEPGKGGPRSVPGGIAAVPLAAFLDQVGVVLRDGLPSCLWIEATVAGVRPSSHGHGIELVDSAPGRGTSATLRAFMPAAALAVIRQDLGIAFDPAMLVGLTIVVAIEPSFSPRWGLSARVVRLAASVETSLKQKLLEEAIAALRREGLWDRQRTLPMPRDVTRVAVVHPAGSAGWADIGTKLDRWEAAGLVAVRSLPVPFEGPFAVAGIVAAIRDAAVTAIHGTAPDLVLLARGGGARAGLEKFDNPDIARAVCCCPVPIVTGIGHATDIALVDRVARAALPTPSLAVMLIGDLIRQAAARAAADHAGVVSAARQRCDAAEPVLATMLQRIEAGLQRRCSDTAATLAACWSMVRVEVVRRREALARDGDVTDALLRSLLHLGPRVIDDEARRSRTLIGRALEQAARAAGRHDADAGLVRAVDLSARELVDRQCLVLDRAWDAITRALDHRMREAEADLGHLAATIDGSDIGSVLQRGFAIVTDPSGALLATRAQAGAAGHLTIRFADGLLEARPVADGATS